MNKENEIKVVQSSTIHNSEITPYLPYLLQDLWGLGSPATDVLMLVRKYIPNYQGMSVLDLACGKGANSIPLAKELGMKVTGVDLVAEFIDYAIGKVKELGIEELCIYKTEDITQTIKHARNYDCVLHLAVGKVLGNPKQIVNTLCNVIKPSGYLIIDEAYDTDENIRIGSKYPSKNDWVEAFDYTSLKLIGRIKENDFHKENNKMYCRVITHRTDELVGQYPQQEEMFRDYLQSQLDECHYIEENITTAVSIFQKLL